MNSMLEIFILMFIGEIGDKNQFILIALASKYSDPFDVFIGVALAFATVNSLSVLIGVKISDKIPTRTIRIISAIIFTMSGVLTLFSSI